MDTHFNESTLRDYVRIIFWHKKVVIITILTVMISVFIGLEFITPVYQAQVKMLISAEKQTSSPYYRDLGSSQLGQISLTQAEIVKSNPVIERAISALKLQERPFDYEKNYSPLLKTWYLNIKNRWRPKLFDSPLKPENHSTELEQRYRFTQIVEGLKDSIQVDTIKDTDLFIISAYDYDPEMAANIANVVSRSFVIFDLEQQLAELRLKYGEKHQIVMQLKDYIDKMTNDLTVMSLPFVEAIGPASVKIIEQAQVPFIPVGHSKRMTVVLAFFMSICAGIMLTFGFEYLDHTFKSPKDVETFLNLPLLGSIQKKGFKDNILIDYSRCITAFSQSYQNISDQIYLLLKDKRLKSILITAASPSDGSSTIIANLSNYLSNKAGHKVIVVDTNLRSPTIHKIFNLSDTTGLANVLENKIPLNNAIYQISSNLAVLPAGNTALNPVTLLESSMMHDVIKTIHNTYEVVIVDYANLSNIKEVYALSSYLDGIVLVVNEGKTRHHVIKTLIAPFRQKKANLIGVILNKRNYVVPRLLYERI